MVITHLYKTSCKTVCGKSVMDRYCAGNVSRVTCLTCLRNNDIRSPEEDRLTAARIKEVERLRAKEQQIKYERQQLALICKALGVSKSVNTKGCTPYETLTSELLDENEKDLVIVGLENGLGCLDPDPDEDPVFMEYLRGGLDDDELAKRVKSIKRWRGQYLNLIKKLS